MTFSFRNRKRGNCRDSLKLPIQDFVARFLRHVVPRRFVRIRYYGLLANAFKAKRLAHARTLLGAPAPPKPQDDQNWNDTYHFSVGAHYKPVDDWLLQAGVTYDTSPVDAKDRTADMPIDRQIRLAVGAQHQLSETMTVGGSFEYIDFGSSRISDPNTLTGDYQTNRAFFFALNANFKL